MTSPAPKPLVIPVFIPHYGCPHQCAFCDQSIITQKGGGQNNEALKNEGMFDAQAIDHLITEFLQYKGKRKQVELAFFGGNFLGLPKETIVRLLEMVEPYVSQGKIQSVRFSTRPDTVTPEILSVIRPYPVRAIELGVQSMNDDVLARARRGHTHKDTTDAIRLLKKNNYKVGAQIMVGLPEDTKASLLASAGKLAALEPDFARIYPLVVLTGSLVEKWYLKGVYQPLDLETAVQRVKEIYLIFSKAKIEVIRMGLQASDFMADETKVVAGPWHPAFGHLVFSSIMYDRACEQLDCCPELLPPGPVVLRVNPRSESRLRGDKNENLAKLHARYPSCDFSIITDDALPLNQVGL